MKNKNRIRVNRSIFICCAGVFLLLSVASFTSQKSQRSNPKVDGYVPDEKTAVRIAEAIWLPIYGERIYENRPFKARLINGSIWRVTGTVHTEQGGAPIAEIRKSDCQIIRIIHDK